MQLNAVRRIAPALVVCAALTAHAADLKLTPSELEQGHLYLQQTRAYVVGATKGLSEAQWKFKPARDRWSIAEIVEHVVVTQEFVLGPIREQLAKAPVASADRDYKQVDGIVVNQLPDRLAKFPAPELLQPTGRWSPAVASDRPFTNSTPLPEFLQPPAFHQPIPRPP